MIANNCSMTHILHAISIKQGKITNKPSVLGVCQFRYSCTMTEERIKHILRIVIIFSPLCCLLATVIFFTIGGIRYAKQRPKVLNYLRDDCVVDSKSYRTYECKRRYSRYTCYSPIWNVRHGEKKDVRAIAVTEKRYTSYDDAMNKADEYEVCNYLPLNPLMLD